MCPVASDVCTPQTRCGETQTCVDGACVESVPLAALPALGPATGAGGAAAFVIVKEEDLVPGDAAQGSLGDVMISNGLARFVIQKPGRDFSVVPYGGHIIDAVAVEGGVVGEDQFGEVMPLLNLGMTVDFNRLQIVRDGTQGGSAVVRAFGRPALWDYINITGFLSDGFSSLTPFDPEEPLPLEVVAQYELGPTSRVLHVSYSLFNGGEFGQRLPVGVALDSGGVVQSFRSGAGFGSPSYSVQGILDGSTAVPWFGFTGRRSNTAIRPWKLYDTTRTEDSSNPTVQVAGVKVSLFSRPDVLAAFADSDFFIEKDQAAMFGFDLAVSGLSMSDASAALLKAQGRPTHDFTVRVRDNLGTDVADATVVIRGLTSEGQLADPVAVGLTDADGMARFSTPPGARKVQVYAPGRPLPTALTLNESLTEFNIPVGGLGTLAYEVTAATRVRSTVRESAPCRITVVGVEQIEDEVLRSADADHPRSGISQVIYSPTCSSEQDERTIPLVPGRYLAVISKGPFYDVVQQLVDVGITGATVTGVLHRVVDGDPYVATDWHQHSVNSPDSPVPLRNRLLSYLGEGIEMFGGSDHDAITDWERLVEEFGFGSRIQAINGVESTTFDYGHFNIFPLTPDPSSVSGGALDWAGGDGPGLAPPQMFRAYRQRGAQVVQVNHPRGGFQGYFDRAALTFDFEAGVARGDVGAQPATNAQLRIQPLEPLWTAEFDAVEVYNGFHLYGGALAGRTRGDRNVDRIMMDVGNLIAVGHRPVMTGTSDTHGYRDMENGYPRTYLRAQRGDDGRVDPWSALGALAGLGHAPNRGDVIASNGPLPIITAKATGRAATPPGGTLVNTSTNVTVDVTVQTPPWMKLTGADIIITPTYTARPAGDFVPAPAVDGVFAEPSVEDTPNGGRRSVYRISLTVDPATHNPFPGKDMALIVRVYSTHALWPIVATNADVTLDEAASTPETFATVANGVAGFAVANPIFVDVDGDGVFRGPHQKN